MSDHDPVLARFFIERPGEVFNGTKSRDTITGTSGADLITGGRGRDDITTGSGNDVLVLSSVLDGLDVVRDFDPARDRIDIRPLLASVLYAGSDPIADGMVLLQAGSDRSTLLFDADGAAGAGVPRPLVELLGVVDATLASLLLPALPG
jgi:Ca2+-binding RTX toxin-like protein